MDIATLPLASADTAAFCEGARLVPVRGTRGGEPFAVQDWVADEVPVAFEYDGASHAVLLATPLDLEDFALGFSLGEGIVDAPHELYRTAVEHDACGIVLRIGISPAAVARLRRMSRDVRDARGVRAAIGAEGVARAAPPPYGTRSPAAAPRFAPAAIARAMAQLDALRTLQQATDAAHAAAWCAADGEVQWLREDVGRRNALDKLLGALAANDVDAAAGFVAVTGRAGVETVQRVARSRVALLAATSAPTAFALEVAERSGLALVRAAGGGDLSVYCGPERLSGEAVPASHPRRAH